MFCNLLGVFLKNTPNFETEIKTLSKYDLELLKLYIKSEVLGITFENEIILYDLINKTIQENEKTRKLEKKHNKIC